MKILVLWTILLLSYASNAQQCVDIFVKDADAAIEVNAERAALIEAIQDNKLPGFKITTSTGEVPAILMTEQSYPYLKGYLNSSYGTQIMAKQGWPNDHGSLRYREYIIDAYIAGERQFGEIYETGLSWKTAEDSIRFIDKIADVFIESSFRLTRTEMDAVDFYQKVRRMALFRVVFPMGNEAIYERLENVLTECREHCFGFSTSDNLSGQTNALQSRVQQLLPAPADFQKLVKETQPLIAEIREDILTMNPLEAEKFNRQFLETPERVEKLSALLGGQVKEADVKTILAYLIGMEATKQFGEVIAAMNPSSAVAFDNQPRLTAILIWTTANQADAINALSFQASGTSFSFSKQNNWVKIHE